MLAGLGDKPQFDVIVVGSGAGGMVSALRAHDLGLNVLVIEKSDRYGGTSAVSGAGLWIPNNPYIRDRDNADKAFDYLKKTTEGLAPEDMLRRYVDYGPRIVDYLNEVGVEYYVNPDLHYPDYHPDVEGALPHGRAMFVKPFDGATLGKEFFNLRESYPEFKLLDRITIDLDEGSAMIHQKRGWMLMLAKQILRYWLDIPWRLKTYRDRRLAHGNALIGGLRKAMLQRGIPLSLKTGMLRLIQEDGRITGIVADCDGQEIELRAARGVILAAGGYEQSSELRARHLPKNSQVSWSVTPRGNNVGDALLAARAVGAKIDEDLLGECWWAPSIAFPSKTSPNIPRNIGIFFERGFPHSLCVNRLGKRFTNEACSYHLFGQAMIADHAASGANQPCWMIFDSRYRRNYPLGALMPGRAVPDSRLPPNWMDTVLYRADTVAALADKIGIPAPELATTITRFNASARQGVDEEFGRGSNFYNAFLGDPKHKPNACLGEIEKGPFYACRLDLGDLGSKGGPVTNIDGQVMGMDEKPIDGLYAVGNCASTLMGRAYPGAGVTLGSTMIFGYLAASHLGQANSGGMAASV
jgi:3-oxosteroid 1-dehydrogenase